MAIGKKNVLSALESVLYFPKGDNVINLNMIQDISIEDKKIRFVIFFPSKDEKNEQVVRDSCIKAVKEAAGNDYEVEATIKTPGNSLEGIKHIIAVASGKGGVGKSTVAANLAVSLSKTGAKTGIIDADIYGPSIPLMFDVMNSRPQVYEKEGKTWIVPLENYGIKILSIGFFVDPEKALIWRGPMASNALKQLFNDSDWGELDYLVVDLPPGTGDIQLTLAQEVSVSGICIVSTPQEVALADARKALSMFNQKQIRIPVLGLIENMSYFSPAELPDNKYYIFGKEGGKKLAEKANVPLLGEIPLVQSVCEAGDKGRPSAMDKDTPVSNAFDRLAENVIRRLKEM
ncbi:MAG: Mrp/NBP35 family ATP-binding protein [Bacteroidales bacterium]